MKITALSKTAAAVALGCAALGAQATAVVTLDFETLGALVLATAPTGGPLTDATPIKLGSTAASTLANFQFLNAWAWEWDMMRSSDPKPSATPLNNGGFILNANRGGLRSDIGLSWAVGLHSGRLLKSISFDLFVTGSAIPFVTGFNASNTPTSTPTFSSGDGSRNWALQQTLSFDSASEISRLSFGASSNAFIGLDNFRVEFFDFSTGRGAVPEPASFGLVALALLGAGVASRRRKPA